MNDMNLEHLRKSLVQAARAHPPSDQVPFAFENRVLAQIRASSHSNASEFWAEGLWRAVLPSVVLLGITSMLHWQTPSLLELPNDSIHGPDELETVMLDVLDPPEAW